MFGMNCLTWFNMISPKSANASHWVMKWRGLSRGARHFSHDIVSENPKVKECSFRRDRPTLIRVRRLHLYLLPLEKNLYLFGVKRTLRSILKSDTFFFLNLYGMPFYLQNAKIQDFLLVKKPKLQKCKVKKWPQNFWITWGLPPPPCLEKKPISKQHFFKGSSLLDKEDFRSSPVVDILMLQKWIYVFLLKVLKQA